MTLTRVDHDTLSPGNAPSSSSPSSSPLPPPSGPPGRMRDSLAPGALGVAGLALGIAIADAAPGILSLIGFPLIFWSVWSIRVATADAWDAYRARPAVAAAVAGMTPAQQYRRYARRTGLTGLLSLLVAVVAVGFLPESDSELESTTANVLGGTMVIGFFFGLFMLTWCARNLWRAHVARVEKWTRMPTADEEEHMPLHPGL